MKDDILINQLKTGKTPVVRACLAFNKKKGSSERMCPECGVGCGTPSHKMQIMGAGKDRSTSAVTQDLGF